MIAGMSVTTLLSVLVAGVAAGFVGYAVGASSLVSYPALLAFGIPPVLSNTTNTVGVCGTGIGGLLSARKELTGQGRRVVVYACIGLVGGAIVFEQNGSAFVAPVKSWESFETEITVGEMLVEYEPQQMGLW